MKKAHKSLQAIIVTILIGMLVPKIADITGIALLDKVIWKIFLSLAFNLANILVGVLFSFKILKGRVEGGRARIIIYLLIVIILLCFTSSILIFFKEISRVVLIIFGAIALIAIVVLIIRYLILIKDQKDKFKTSQVKSVDNVINSKSNQSHKDNTQPNKTVKPISNKVNFNKLNPSHDKQDTKSTTNKTIYKTVYELWRERDTSKKCITITNSENPDLKWVKIYKPPYGNGKFYGYVMMQNARNTVNGEIYFADKPIWVYYNN